MKVWVVTYSHPGFTDRYVMEVEGETEVDVRAKLTQYLQPDLVFHSVRKKMGLKFEEIEG